MGKKKKAIVDQMKPKFLKQGQENGHIQKCLKKFGVTGRNLLLMLSINLMLLAIHG